MGFTDQSPISIFQKEAPKLLKEAHGCQKKVCFCTIPLRKAPNSFNISHLTYSFPSVVIYLFSLTLGGVCFLFKIVTRMSS